MFSTINIHFEKTTEQYSRVYEKLFDYCIIINYQITLTRLPVMLIFMENISVNCNNRTPFAHWSTIFLFFTTVFQKVLDCKLILHFALNRRYLNEKLLSSWNSQTIYWYICCIFCSFFLKITSWSSKINKDTKM